MMTGNVETVLAMKEENERLRAELALSQENNQFLTTSRARYEMAIAAAVDHMNTWARELQAKECKDPWTNQLAIRELAERLWQKVMERERKSSAEVADLRAKLGEATRELALAKNFELLELKEVRAKLAEKNTEIITLKSDLMTEADKKTMLDLIDEHGDCNDDLWDTLVRRLKAAESRLAVAEPKAAAMDGLQTELADLWSRLGALQDDPTNNYEEQSAYTDARVLVGKFAERIGLAAVLSALPAGKEAGDGK